MSGTPGTSMEGALAELLAGNGRAAVVMRSWLCDGAKRLVGMLGDGSLDGAPQWMVETCAELQATVQGLIRPRSGSAGPVDADRDDTALDNSSLDPSAVVAARPPEPDPADQLISLALQVAAELGLELPKPEPDPAGWWEWLHLGALRLDEAGRQQLRADAAEATGVHDPDDRLVPACPVLDHPGWDGLDDDVRSQVDTALKPDVRQQYPDIFDALVVVWSLVGRCPDLRTGQSAQTSHGGVTELDPPSRATAWTSVLNQLKALDARQPAANLSRLVRCDEAVRAVLPLPLPSPRSWWAAVGRQSLQALQQAAEACGAELVVVQPGESVSMVQKSLKADGLVKARVANPRPGQVLWMLSAGFRHAPGAHGPRVLIGEA